MNGIVIFSGGMDSIALLHHLKEKGHTLYGLSFFYGQRHEKELDFAQYWGEKLCVAWKKIDISFMKEIAGHSALIDPNISLPREHYTNENQKITVVPNRNMVMAAIAVAWAEDLGFSKVFLGVHANDRAIYPDCRHEFIEAVSQASVLATYHRVEIQAPFVHFQKFEIARLGHDLGVDYRKTWSCYEGKERHCGKCATCQERKEAFAKANLEDPTDYDRDL